MRVEIAIVGAVLAIVGAVLWVVPLTPASTNVPVPVGDAYDFGVPSDLIVGAIPYTASWTASTPANLTIYKCGTDSTCANATSDPVVAQGVGTTGSVSWSSHAGLYYLLVPNASVNITLTYHEPISGGLAGLAVLAAGVLVLVAGVAMRRPQPPDGPPPSAT